MSLRKRKFIGELSKRDLSRTLITGGIVAAILIAAYISYPLVIDAFFGGSRGGYDTQADLPTTKQTYNLTAIPFKINVVIDPSKLNANMLNLLKTLFDTNNMQLPSNFMNLNPATYNVVLFYYQDLSFSPYNNGIMRQDAYDTMSSNGSTWSKSINTQSLFSSQNYDHGSFSTLCRKIIFNMTSTTNINMKLPFFPYTPTYVQNSLMLQDASGGTTPISDSNTLYKTQDDAASIQASGLPSLSGANLTYCIKEDPTMSSSIPSLVPSQDSPPVYANYIQMPGVGSSRDLTSYLANHPRFNTAYTNIVNQGYNKRFSRTCDILQGIQNYLYSNYDLYTAIPPTGPARPPSGQDMVEWFLARTKATNPNAGGTPYDFASAFVMLARAFDIPARVAIGFYDWDHDNKIEVMNAYAWAEAYLPTQSSPSYAGQWIVYDFPAAYNVNQLANPPVPQFITVNQPAQGSTVNQTTLIPLDITMGNTTSINTVTYSLDGGTHIQVPYSQIGTSGIYQAISTFNVASSGPHTIQAFMAYTNGTVIASAVNSFTVNVKPDASFTTLTPVKITQGQSVSFLHTGSNGVTPATYYWDFGDGMSAIVENPSHQYNTVGNFTVSLTVTDANGSTSTVTKPLLVHVKATNPPNVSFVANPTSIQTGQFVTFTSTVTNGYPPLAYSWNFGDSGTSTQANPAHQYNTPGNYTVSLTVTDNYSESTTFQRFQYINVSATPPIGIPTTLTVDFNPKAVEIFQYITISGTLQNSSTLSGIGGQVISIAIQYYLGAQLKHVDTLTRVTNTTVTPGNYQLTQQVLWTSDLIRVIATYTSNSTLYLSSSAMVQG